jgi:hypothetical protein
MHTKKLLEIYENLTPELAETFLEYEKTLLFRWVEYGGKAYGIASDVSKCNGKARYDYITNYKRLHPEMVGSELKLKPGEEMSKVIELFNTKYPYHRPLRVNRELTLIDLWQVLGYLRYTEQSPTYKLQCFSTLGQEIYFDTRWLEKEYGIQPYEIDEYLQSVPDVMPRREPNRVRSYYLVNEIGFMHICISANIPKQSMFEALQKLAQAKKVIKQKTGVHTMKERYLQQLFIELCSHANIKCQSEFPIPSENGYRIDLVLDDSVAFEFKMGKVNISVFKEAILEKKYADYLRTYLPNFKKIILCSPSGVTEDIQELINYSDYILFRTPKEVGAQIADRILEYYPKNHHWWVKSVLFPRYEAIVPREYMTARFGYIDKTNPIDEQIDYGECT